MKRPSCFFYIQLCIVCSVLSACGSGGGGSTGSGEEFTLQNSALSIEGQDIASIGDSFRPVRVSAPQSQGVVMRIDWQAYDQSSPEVSDYLAEFSVLFDAYGVVEALAYHYEDHVNGIDYDYLLDCVIPSRCDPVNIYINQKSISLANLEIVNSLLAPSQSTSPITLDGSLQWQ